MEISKNLAKDAITNMEDQLWPAQIRLTATDTRKNSAGLLATPTGEHV